MFSHEKLNLSYEESNWSLIPDLAVQFSINQAADNWLMSLVLREKNPAHSICRVSVRMKNSFKKECDALIQASSRTASVTEERLHREEHGSWTRTSN